MRLHKLVGRYPSDTPAGSLVVTCAQCGSVVELALTYSDLDGPAFQSYYCQHCVELLHILAGVGNQEIGYD